MLLTACARRGCSAGGRRWSSATEPVPILEVRDRAQVRSAAFAPWPAQPLEVERRLDHGADRPERRRQDDALQPRHRLPPRRLAARSLSTAARSSAGRRTGSRRAAWCAHSSSQRHSRRMPVLDNMMLAAPGQPGEHLRALLWPLARSAGASARCARRALELLEMFGLAAKAADYAGTLSGGQRKLLELARALMARAAARPARRADGRRQPDARRRLLDYIERLRRERGHHVPLRRARHGRGDEPRRPRRRDGGGPRDRRGEPHEVRADPAVDRRLSRRARQRGSARDRRPRPCSSVEAWSPATSRGRHPERAVDSTVRSGEIVTVDRPQRRRQVDADQDDLSACCAPRRGRDLSLRGRDIAGLRPHAIARWGVGYVPQRDNVFPTLTVEENLELGAAAATAHVDARAPRRASRSLPAPRATGDASTPARSRVASGRCSRWRGR